MVLLKWMGGRQLTYGSWLGWDVTESSKGVVDLWGLLHWCLAFDNHHILPGSYDSPIMDMHDVRPKSGNSFSGRVLGSGREPNQLYSTDAKSIGDP